MKNKVQHYVQSIAVLFVFTMLFSLIFATLYYFNVIDTKTFHILNWISGILAYGAGGFWLGKCIEKKALLNASFIVVILAIPALILNDFTLISIIETTTKLFAYIGVCMITFTKTHHS